MRRPTLVIAICLLAAACAKDAKPGGQATTAPPSAPGSSAPPTESPSPSPTPATITYGKPFYVDEFRDKKKGWPERDSDTATYVVHDDYALPLYTMTAKKPKYELFPAPEFRGVTREELADYRVEATLQTTLSIGRADWFGVTCRQLDDKRYSFQVAYSTSGDDVLPWRIMKHDGNGRTVLASGEASVGGSAFGVAGTCVGGADGGPAQLVLAVNDKEVGRAEDATAPLTQGLAGVYLYTDNGKSTLNVLGFAVGPAVVG